jgi:hypothetical protein
VTTSRPCDVRGTMRHLALTCDTLALLVRRYHEHDTELAYDANIRQLSVTL